MFEQEQHCAIGKRILELAPTYHVNRCGMLYTNEVQVRLHSTAEVQLFRNQHDYICLEVGQRTSHCVILVSPSKSTYNFISELMFVYMIRFTSGPQADKENRS